MTEPFWLTRARAYIGQREQAGAANNPRIVRWWTLIGAPFRDDETPWCSAAVCGILEECGIRSARTPAARGNLPWGIKLSAPALGCIVVFERGPKNGHVAFVAGRDQRGNLMCLGGNQGNMVKISPFPVSRVLGYRWPPGQPIPHTGFDTLPLATSTDLVSVNEQ